MQATGMNRRMLRRLDREQGEATEGNIDLGNRKTSNQYAEGILIKQHRSLCFILVGILFLAVISKAYMLLKLAVFSPFGNSTYFLVVLGLVIVVLYLLLIYYLVKGHFRAYNIVIALSILGIGESAKGLLAYGIAAVIDMAIVIIVLILALYLKKKLFPNYSVWAFKQK